MEASTQAGHRPASTRKALTIGAVAKILEREFDDISISKIRYLEDQKLLSPRRTPGGYRLYSQADVERLRSILRMQRDEFLPLRVIRQELASGGRRAEGHHRQREPRCAGPPASRPAAALAPHPRRDGRADRPPAPSVISRPRGVAHRPAEADRGRQDLRRHRPRDRQGVRRAGALRRRRPQPARAPHRRRPRGPAARAGDRPRAPVLEPDRAARRRSRTSRPSRPPPAASPTCCWSATCAS